MFLISIADVMMMMLMMMMMLLLLLLMMMMMMIGKHTLGCGCQTWQAYYRMWMPDLASIL